jgi:hypothetical protein
VFSAFCTGLQSNKALPSFLSDGDVFKSAFLNSSHNKVFNIDEGGFKATTGIELVHDILEHTPNKMIIIRERTERILGIICSFSSAFANPDQM